MKKDTRKARNTRKAWTPDDESLMKELVVRRASLDEIARLLGRTERAVHDRLYRCHHAWWVESGHPQSATQPKNGTDHKQVLSTAQATLSAVMAVDEKIDRVCDEIEVVLGALRRLMADLGDSPKESSEQEDRHL